MSAAGGASAVGRNGYLLAGIYVRRVGTWGGRCSQIADSQCPSRMTRFYGPAAGRK